MAPQSTCVSEHPNAQMWTVYVLLYICATNEVFSVWADLTKSDYFVHLYHQSLRHFTLGRLRSVLEGDPLTDPLLEDQNRIGWHICENRVLSFLSPILWRRKTDPCNPYGWPDGEVCISAPEHKLIAFGLMNLNRPRCKRLLACLRLRIGIACSLFVPSNHGSKIDWRTVFMNRSLWVWYHPLET